MSTGLCANEENLMLFSGLRITEGEKLEKRIYTLGLACGWMGLCEVIMRVWSLGLKHTVINPE